MESHPKQQFTLAATVVRNKVGKNSMDKKLTYFSFHMYINNPTELKSVATEPHLWTSPGTS